jgi:hypothetical protein
LWTETLARTPPAVKGILVSPPSAGNVYRASGA